MNRVFVQVLLYSFISTAGITGSAFAQTLGLSDKVNNIIHRYCTICLEHPGDSSQLRNTAHGKDEAAINFHNCLVSLKNNDQINGFGYALETITATASTPDAPVCLYTRFLKARILYLKDGYKEALAEYLQLANSKSIDSSVSAYIYSNIASIYAQQKEFRKALNYFAAWEKVYSLFTEPPASRKIYNNIGACYLHLENYTEADVYFQKSIAIAEHLNDTLGLANLYINIGSYYYNLDLVRRAFPFFKKALVFAKRSNNNEILGKAFQNMAIIEEKDRKFRLAYEYRKLYDSVIEIKWNSDNISGLKDREKEMAVQQQEHKLQLSRQQNKLQALELSKRNWQRYTLLALATLFLSFAAFISRAYRQKAKRNKIIDGQKEELSLLNQTKDQLFSIISHDLRTLVYTLKITLARLRIALSQNQLQDAASLAESTETISSSTYALLNNLLHWALSQTGQLSYKPEKILVKEVADQVYNDLIPVAASKMITLADATPVELFITGDINAIKIILRNLVDNAIKYTPMHGTITISAEQAAQHCNITISDSGIGMEQSVADAIITSNSRRIQKDTHGNRSTGLGLWLVKTMTEKNGGQLFITTKKGEGTAVTVSFPLAA